MDLHNGQLHQSLFQVIKAVPAVCVRASSPGGRSQLGLDDAGTQEARSPPFLLKGLMSPTGPRSSRPGRDSYSGHRRGRERGPRRLARAGSVSAGSVRDEIAVDAAGAGSATASAVPTRTAPSSSRHPLLLLHGRLS